MTELCCLYPAYGAMVKALPQDAHQLNGLTEELIIQAVIPFFKAPQTKPINERQFNQWFSKANTLNGLDDLAELDGLRKKLKKIAKKVVKIHKKVGKALTSKKLAKPFAFALGAATGTLPMMMKLNQMRNQYRAQRAQMRGQAEESQDMQGQEQADMSMEQMGMTQGFVSTQPIDYSQVPQMQMPSAPYEQPVQRLAQPQEQDESRIVGLNTGGILEHIKANPVPWAIGAGVVVLLVTRK